MVTFFNKMPNLTILHTLLPFFFPCRYLGFHQWPSYHRWAIFDWLVLHQWVRLHYIGHHPCPCIRKSWPTTGQLVYKAHLGSCQSRKIVCRAHKFNVLNCNIFFEFQSKDNRSITVEFEPVTIHEIFFFNAKRKIWSKVNYTPAKCGGLP